MSTHGGEEKNMTDAKTALLVDDNDELRAATREYLEDMGYVVATASDAEEVLAADSAAEGDFDLLVSDIYMPGMHGIELVDRLLKRQPGLAVLLVSSRGGEPEVRRRLALGDVAFLPKPFSPDELAERVGEAFARVSKRRTTPGAQRAGAAPSRRLETKGALQVVGAVVLVLGLGALFRGFGQGAPPLPATAPGGVTRSATIEIAQPLGPQATAPDELVWSPVNDASSYAVSLRTIDGTALWQTEVSSTPADVPTTIKSGLHRAVTYYWSVEALDTERNLVARSELAPFVIELPPRELEVQHHE